MKQQFVIETETNNVPINRTNIESAIERYVQERLKINLISVDVHEIFDRTKTP